MTSQFILAASFYPNASRQEAHQPVPGQLGADHPHEDVDDGVEHFRLDDPHQPDADQRRDKGGREQHHRGGKVGGVELAEQIITNRDTVRNQAKNSFWLLENRLVNIEQMKSIADHVTVRGEVCRFVYAGWSHPSLAPVAFRTLVDASGESAVVMSNQKITMN